jgi:hypothetical protein
MKVEGMSPPQLRGSAAARFLFLLQRSRAFRHHHHVRVCRSSFEVTVNKTYLAFSKLEKRTFPDFAGLAKEIAEFAATGKVPDHWKKL